MDRVVEALLSHCPPVSQDTTAAKSEADTCKTETSSAAVCEADDHAGQSEDGEAANRAANPARCCLFRSRYVQYDRHTDKRWNADSADGKVLSACSEGRSLFMCTDPAAAPQLLVGRELFEAREAFVNCPIFGEQAPCAKDFLRKPDHLVLEENNVGMEDLEQFNADMRDATAHAPAVEDTEASRTADAALQTHSKEDAFGLEAAPLTSSPVEVEHSVTAAVGA